MSTETTPAEAESRADDAHGDATDLASRVTALEEQIAALEADRADDAKRVAIVATKGSLDMAYPPLILASTAAAFGWDVTVFHTFWGLDVLHEEKSKNLKLSAVGNPSMGLPNAIAALPGMDALATRMMRRRIDENGTASVEELIDLALESGVSLKACGMTMDLMGYEAEDLYDGVTADVGAATALADMADADIQLLV